MFRRIKAFVWTGRQIIEGWSPSARIISPCKYVLPAFSTPRQKERLHCFFRTIVWELASAVSFLKDSGMFSCAEMTWDIDLFECIDDMTNDYYKWQGSMKRSRLIRPQLWPGNSCSGLSRTEYVYIMCALCVHISYLFWSALSGRFAMSWLSGSVFAASSSSWGFSCKRNRFDAKFSLDSTPQD